MKVGSRIALLGAESTGKTRLAGELATHLRQQGRTVVVVAEVLREWCERAGRSPDPHEQLPIAQEQERRVAQAAQEAEIVIADTTALMVAIYAGMLYPDGELLRFALASQRTYQHTLLTGLDLPWVPDGLLRQGPQARGPVDALVRKFLGEADLPYRVVYGQGPQRLANALDAIHGASAAPPATAGALAPSSRRWQWNCEKCSDPQCEHRLFTGLAERGSRMGAQ